MRHVLICVVLTFTVCAATFTQTAHHEVGDGETLYGIARQYGVPVDRLIRANRIGAPELLLPGTILTIPGNYEVRRGDTLFSIARAHGTSVDEIRALNDLESTTIRIGQTLRLPIDKEDPEGPPMTDTTPSVALTDGDDENEAEPTHQRLDPIPVAVSIVEPLSFSDGGSWPVAGTRRTLDGKFPGVLIESSRGVPVTNVASGRVVYAGPHSSFGNVIFVQSPRGYIYVYGGQESIAVEVGDDIDAGISIGTVGVSPTEGSAAIYFSVWFDDRFVDPEVAPRG